MSEEHRCDGHEGHRLEVDDLCVTYGEVVALCEVNFATTCGHRLALLGPNGAGKTTLIRTLAGLLGADHGSIRWRGRQLVGSTQEIAYLPQLDRHREGFPLTVHDVVAMGRYPHLGPWRSFGKKDADKVAEAISTMHLEDLAGRQIDQLSGGQRQRAFIARALAQEAHIVMLDEPFNGLDVESAADLTETLHDLSRSGHLVIASHHQLETVTACYDQALVLQREQVAFGPVAEVLEAPKVREALSLGRRVHV